MYKMYKARGVYRLEITRIVPVKPRVSSHINSRVSIKCIKCIKLGVYIDLKLQGIVPVKPRVSSHINSRVSIKCIMYKARGVYRLRSPGAMIGLINES